MILGIDASNIRAGGGLTHLKEILGFADPISSGFSKVIVWSSDEILNMLPNHSWLIKLSHKFLNKSFLWAFVFQFLILKKVATDHQCNIMYVPGGTFIGFFRPFVTMSQNMLPFELNEAFRFNSFPTRLRFLMLRVTQSFTFKRADGMVFLTKYAYESISKKIKLAKNEVRIIPHGINPQFSHMPKVQNEPDYYNNKTPFKLLYVSIITAYKHQWNVADAVCKLHAEGLPIQLNLIGVKDIESYWRLQRVMDSYPDSDKCIIYHGKIEHKDLFKYYEDADAFVFASSCENLPIILLEAMSAGLPITSSNMGPMPEVLQDAGYYFNPLDAESIYESIKELYLNSNTRSIIANKAYNITKNFTWANCAAETFNFLAHVSKIKKNEK